jgi:hypothetical protein
MEQLRLTDFDIFGIFRANNEDLEGLEKFVSKIDDKKSLSRSNRYYDSLTYSEHNHDREYLKSLLRDAEGKRAFVICENMLNSSAKVYYNEVCKKVRTGNSEYFEIAKKCFEEDCNNLIRVLKCEEIEYPINKLPDGDDKTHDRFVELDNKALIYLLVNSLNFEKKYQVITPGLGSIYVGPFIKNIYGFDYSIVDFSMYKDLNLRNETEKRKFVQINISDYLENKNFLENGTPICLFDDNIGSGRTLRLLSDSLNRMGIENISGICQIDWKRWIEVKKSNHLNFSSRFNPSDIEFLPPVSFPGRDKYKKAFEKFKNPNEYIKYIKESNFVSIDPLIKTTELYIEKAKKVDNLNPETDISKNSIKLKTNFTFYNFVLNPINKKSPRNEEGQREIR